MPSVSEKTSHLETRQSGLFAVYVGDGRYVSDLAFYGGDNTKRHGRPFGFVHIGAIENCLSLARHEAVTACHAARRAGVPAWVVRHPLGVAL